MFIEDEELRQLYRDASREHLDKLDNGVLHLEKHPEDTNQLQELLREAHSLKGDSRMLGVVDAETLTHQVEELLIGVEKGTYEMTAALCDRIYLGLDAVRKVTHEAITGEPAELQLNQILAQIMAVDDLPEAPKIPASDNVNLEDPDPNEDPDPEPSDLDLIAAGQPFIPAGLDLSRLDPEIAAALRGTPEPAAPTNNIQPPPAAKVPAAQSSAPAETYQIDTVRVAASTLDLLITHASELAVTKLRIARQLDDIAQIQNIWQVWSQENLAQRPMLEQLEQHVDPDYIAPLQATQQLHENYLEQLGSQIRQLRSATAADTTRLEAISNELESGIVNLRMLPLSNLFSLFPRLVRDLAKEQRKEIDFVTEGGDTLADKRILEEMKDPLTHLIRNAIDHGIEPPADRLAVAKTAKAHLCLRGYAAGNNICIELVDDGRGLDLGKIKRTAIRRGLYHEAELEQMSPEQIQALIFEPGFSTRTTTTELSGRGVGLDVVRTHTERLKGSIQVTSTPTQGCTFCFTLGTNLNTTYALIATVDQAPYAIPVESVEILIRVQYHDIFTLDGNPMITFQEQPLALAWLSELLELPTTPRLVGNMGSEYLNCVVLKVGSERLGLLVDNVLEQQDIVLKPQSKLLKRIRNITGATILSNGEVCMVLNPQDLVRSIRKNRSQSGQVEVARFKVLLVENSIPIRTQMSRILQGAGYEVAEAVDGLDGFEKLGLDTFDAVVSDIEMPNLNGLELTRRIRQQNEYQELPIILLSTLAKNEDRRLGTEAGASAYLSKGDFDQTLLLDTLRRLI